MSTHTYLIEGSKFQRLTVLNFSHVKTYIKKDNSKLREYYYTFKCECNKVVTIKSRNVVNGNVQSCGCYRYDKLREYHKKSHLTEEENFESGCRRIFRMVRESSGRRNKYFELTLEDIKELVFKECTYCGLKSSNRTLSESKKYKLEYNGLDRVDSSIGYIRSNVVPCCTWCNKAKSSMTLEEFKAWIKRVYNKTILDGTTNNI